MNPEGSIFIDKIDYTKLKFLSRDGIVDSITESDYNLETGKPLNNLLHSSKVDTFFIKSLSDNLFESRNINDNLIYKYPKLLEVDTLRDMEVTDKTIIDAVFVYEGASMKNMFGYYMYTVDAEGNKKILDTDPNSNSGNYYSPTVIFPHIYSDETIANTIQQGDKRRLKGNNPDGTFSNIFIGLFLIPHGWYAYQTKGPIDNNAIFYSTIEFNQTYKNSEYQTVNDKIYSIYFKTKSEKDEELLLVGFEDIFLTGTYDLDYNDCVIGFEISDVKNIVDYDKYSTVEVDDTEEEERNKNNVMFIDDDGEYLELDKYIDNINKKVNHIFERHMIFNNQEDRDKFYNVYNSSNLNYKLSITKVTEFGQYKLISSYRLRPNDLKNLSNDDGSNAKSYIYLYEAKFNKNNNSVLNDYKSVLAKTLEDITYSERYRLYEEATSKPIIQLTDLIDTPQKTNVSKFRITGNGVMDCINGKSHLPFQSRQIYQVYKNYYNDTTGIKINVKMDTHPTGYMSSKKTFVRYISFRVNNELLVIDLADLSLYNEVSGSLVPNNTPRYTNIEVSSVINTNGNIKDLITVFKSDSGAFYRTVTLNGLMKFHCVRLPNVKNNPTLVLLHDSSYVDWNTKSNRLSGTYFNKSRTYPIDNFSS